MQLILMKMWYHRFVIQVSLEWFLWLLGWQGILETLHLLLFAGEKPRLDWKLIISSICIPTTKQYSIYWRVVTSNTSGREAHVTGLSVLLGFLYFLFESAQSRLLYLSETTCRATQLEVPDSRCSPSTQCVKPWARSLSWNGFAKRKSGV